MPDCANCPKRNGCVGMQYDYYCMSYKCPYDRLVTDNKTTMTNPSAMYGTTQPDGTGKE